MFDNGEATYMKKIIAFVLALVCVLGLVGCSGGDTNNAGPEAGTPLSTFYQAVLDTQPEDAEELIFFEESNPDLIASFYPGLESVELNQQAFYMPPIVTAPCEIVLVEVKNTEDVQTVEDIFHARIDLGANNVTYPESAAGWQTNAQVQQSGNFLCMIVLPDGHVIPEDVFSIS